MLNIIISLTEVFMHEDEISQIENELLILGENIEVSWIEEDMISVMNIDKTFEEIYELVDSNEYLSEFIDSIDILEEE